MLAFLDSPIQLAVVMVVVLIVFGPEKMKDIGKQLGRAIREIRRAGTDFKNTLEIDENHYQNDYNPPKYDSYGNSYDASTNYSTSSIPEEDVHPAIEAKAETPEEPHRGDFAAAALSDSSDDYAVSLAPASPPATSQASPASGDGVPASPMPVYGVLATPEQSVPREKSTTH